VSVLAQTATDFVQPSDCGVAAMALPEATQRLQSLREAASCPGYSSDGDSVPFMEALGRMACLPVTRQLLHESGAGRELNNVFFRTHNCSALRQNSRRLIRCWRSLISIQDAVAAATATAADHLGPKGHNCLNVPSGGQQTGRSDSSCDGSGKNGHTNVEQAADTDLTRRTVTELKATIMELGLDASLCIEKSELVALLRTVGPSQTPIHGARRLSLRSQDRRGSFLRAARRKSLVAAVGRKSWLRAAAHAAKPVQNKAKAAAGSAQRRKHLQHIAQATDDFAALGLLRAELQATPLKARSELVVHKWRKLAAVVHPDKCSPDLATLATRAFRRLAAAKNRILQQL